MLWWLNGLSADICTLSRGPTESCSTYGRAYHYNYTVNSLA